MSRVSTEGTQLEESVVRAGVERVEVPLHAVIDPSPNQPQMKRATKRTATGEPAKHVELSLTGTVNAFTFGLPRFTVSALQGQRHDRFAEEVTPLSVVDSSSSSDGTSHACCTAHRTRQHSLSAAARSRRLKYLSC
jgi:hypothetical protein